MKIFPQYSEYSAGAIIMKRFFLNWDFHFGNVKQEIENIGKLPASDKETI